MAKMKKNETTEAAPAPAPTTTTPAVPDAPKFPRNSVKLTGNIVADAEVRQAGTTRVAKARVAISTDYKDKNTGEWVKKPAVFVDVEQFEAKGVLELADVKKGDRVQIEGNLALDEWTNKEGEKRSKLYVRVFSAVIVPKAKADEAAA